MNKAQYLEFHKTCCEKLQAITKAKNSDYTGTSDDPFANFSSTETVAGVSTEQGFLVRMGDKMARIKSFTQKGSLEVKDESVEDTLLDLANYCILLAGYMKGARAQPPVLKVAASSGITSADMCHYCQSLSVMMGHPKPSHHYTSCEVIQNGKI